MYDIRDGDIRIRLLHVMTAHSFLVLKPGKGGPDTRNITSKVSMLVAVEVMLGRTVLEGYESRYTEWKFADSVVLRA